MRRIALLCVTGIGLAGVLRQGAESSTESAERDERAHGRYLVHEVAMCVQCHSPRDERGALVPERLLTGAAVPVAAPAPLEPFWAQRAPHLRGLPGYREEQAVRLLTEGIAADGRAPRPPMPPFRMSESDARAVYRYLSSLE